MTPIEEQILKNQATILMNLTILLKHYKPDFEGLMAINKRMEETSKFFKEEVKDKEPCCEMPEAELICECGFKTGIMDRMIKHIEKDGNNCKKFVKQNKTEEVKRK